MPIAINSSPTPSASGMPNTAPRTTATSRRGGRTRSRSPPVIGGRMTTSGSPFPPQPIGPGDNPSSAAAAAAAAAKAYSTASRPLSSWPESSTRNDPGGYHAYDKLYHSGHPANNWPPAGGNVGDDPRSSYRYPSEYQGYTGGRYRDDRYQDGRYREMRDQYYDERAVPVSHHRSSRGGMYPLDYRYSHGRDYRTSSMHPSHRPTSSGSTSLVIGGATPIHVPKSTAGDHRQETESRASSRHSSRRGTADSVFRGRPGDPPHVAVAADTHDSPQKILMSLRTPTASFEDKDRSDEKKDAALGMEVTGMEVTGKPVDLLVENRSPEDSKNSGSIETAPSFSLFNQSFDSFGDGHYFNVDSTLQIDSFGMGRIASIDPEAATQILHSSSGNFSQQILNSNSAGLTLGYSPVNSFGNASTSNHARRSNNTMVVGGEDASNSPSQALVYRSYSNGGSRMAGPLDDSHLRMSVGSFGLGATSLPYTRSYGEGPTGSSTYCYGSVRTVENSDGSPSFYNLLVKYKSAFKDCSFLLPGLKAALLESAITGKDDGSTSPIAIETGSSSVPMTSIFGDPSPQDIAIARRRVESSIFAFGGNPRTRESNQCKSLSEPDTSSIFRSTKGDGEKEHSATITPGSTTSSNQGYSSESRLKSKYEEELPSRYYENESRLSWEFEENPPVEIRPESEEVEDDSEGTEVQTKNPASADGRDQTSHDETEDGKSTSEEKRQNPIPSSPQPKMRYRCKLCGQPKQNHTCPYQQSLARSIGIMVFPSVNAFTANEPGTLAPPLIEMNNFFDARDPGSNDSSPNRPSPDRMRSRMSSAGPVSATTQVTPESIRSSTRMSLHSPCPSATTPGRTPNRLPTPSRNMVNSASSRKRPFGAISGATEERDLLFMETMDLKAEQFRVVTPSKMVQAPEAFSYASLPLPYAQRKRLSDNLFALSNEVPKLTDECAQVLREAREKDMWDLAVAELMTQVIVIIHCPDGDARFEGLRQYLLTLGIAC